MGRLTCLWAISAALSCAQPSFVRSQYVAGGNDLLAVTITNSGATYTAPYNVRNDGSILVPSIGAIKAEGRTVEEIGRAIADKLKTGEIGLDPKVLVSVLAFNAGRIIHTTAPPRYNKP